MKKIFSLFAAVLLAGSMFAAEETVTFSEQGYSNGQTVASYTGTNFSIAFAKGSNANNSPAYYDTGAAVRCYGGNTFTVSSSSSITSIVMTFGEGDKTNGITADSGAFDTGTWTGSATSVVFTIGGTSGHRRIASLTVTTSNDSVPGTDTISTIDPQPGSDTTTIDPQPADSVLTMTCAEARTAALSVSGNNEEYNNGATYQVQGYVTEIAFAYSDSYHNMSFWMADAVDGGKVLEAYKCTIDSEINAPKVGDLVKVTGKLTKYNTTPEFAAGCTCVIVEPATTPVEPQHNYASIEELIAANLPAGTTDVIVTFVNAKITGFYLNSSQQKKGIYIDKQTSDNKDLEIYFSKSGVNVPDEWEIDGYVSGTITGKWDFFERDSQWEIVPTTANWSWAELTYSAVPSAVDNAAVAAPVTKLIRNGQVIILRDGIEYNMLGAEVK